MGTLEYDDGTHDSTGAYWDVLVVDDVRNAIAGALDR